MEKIFCRKYFIFYVLLLLTVVGSKPVRGQGTTVGFYGSTCPQVESIVKSTVQTHFQLNPRIAPGLLRMHFHDCFVRGCDASVLINGDSAERTTPANQLLKGFDVIDDAKTQLEAVCPGVVSCADILALATRDAVTLTNGPHWEVPTGRRDGLTSLASETSNLPSFGDTVDVQKSKFAQKGLETVDLVTLVGAHTIGTAACFTFSNRLYNFPSTGNGVDPSIDPSFLPQLQTLCPQNGDSTRRVELDIGSVDNFDTSYFQNLRNGRGVLESDQRLWADPSTRTVAENYLGRATGSDESKFYNAFVESMIKMSNIGILTGSEGEIRKVCSAFN